MKRFAALLVALALLACAVPALGEGALNIAQENFYVIGSSSLYGYLYVKLENIGDAPIKVDGGELEILNPDGEVLASTTTLWRYAEYLKPGEYTYAYFTQRIDGIESADEVGSYTVTVNSKDTVDRESFRIPSESVFEDDVVEGYWTHDYMTTTFTNDTDQVLYDAVVVRALLDAHGNILYLDSDSMYNYKGLAPGSSIVERRVLSTNFENYFAEAGIQPASVDGIAYANVPDASVYTRGGAAQIAEPEATPEAAPEAVPEAEPTAEPEAAPEVTYPTLQKGSKGEDVRKLQQRLKDLGYLTGKVDGDFGKGTAKAVTAFQKKAGLTADGVADDATQKALFADDAPRA